MVDARRRSRRLRRRSKTANDGTTCSKNGRGENNIYNICLVFFVFLTKSTSTYTYTFFLFSSFLIIFFFMICSFGCCCCCLFVVCLLFVVCSFPFWQDSIVAKFRDVNLRSSADFPSSNRKKRIVDLSNHTPHNDSRRVGMRLGHVLASDKKGASEGRGDTKESEASDGDSSSRTGKREPQWKSDAGKKEYETGSRVRSSLEWSDHRDEYPEGATLEDYLQSPPPSTGSRKRRTGAGKKQKTTMVVDVQTAGVTGDGSGGGGGGAGLNTIYLHKTKSKKRMEAPVTRGQHRSEQVATLIQHQGSFGRGREKHHHQQQLKRMSPMTISKNLFRSPTKVLHLASPPPPPSSV